MKTNSNCCAAAYLFYLLLFRASYYLHSPSIASGACYRRSACIDMDVLGLQQWLVATWADFLIAWCAVRLISLEKDWKHVSIQKAVTLSTCCDIACLTFQFPHITTGCFQGHLTTGSFQSTNIWWNAANLLSDKKSFAFHKLVLWLFRWNGQVDYSLFFFWDNVNNQKYVTMYE